MNDLFLIGIVGLVLFICWLSVRKEQVNASSRVSYFLSGQNVGAFPLTMTFVATVLGGGLIIGSAQEAFNYGPLVFLYPAGSALGLFLLGSGFGSRLRKLEMTAISDLFLLKYGSMSLKIFADVVSWVSLFAILVAQCIAARLLFESLGVSLFFFVAIWLFILFYTAKGGMAALIKTDVVQAAFMIGSLFLVFLLCQFSLPDLLTLPASSEVAKTPPPWLSWFLMPVAYAFVEQDLAQRCLSAKEPSTVSKSAWAAGIILLLVAVVPISIGLYSRQIGMDIPADKGVFFVAIGQLVPEWSVSLATGAVLIAIASTSDSILNSLSALTKSEIKAFGLDYKIPFNLATVAIGAASIILSLYFDSVVGVLMLSYELAVCCLFFPVLFGVFSKEPDRRKAFISVAGGMIGFMSQFAFEEFIPHEVLGLGLAGVGFLLPSSVIWGSRVQV